tara:strand:+ start:9192 stop:10031 length:840 start_codon:yes stop_codon:yes gene_type:complete
VALMASYPSIVPFLNIVPPPGYRLHQVLPLDRLAQQIRGESAILDIRRDVLLGGEVVDRRDETLILQNGVWANPGAGAYELDPIEGSDWLGGQSLGFVETRIAIRNGVFSWRREPGSYVVFSGAGRKTFLSDNSPKFSHPAVIQQIAAYGKWAEGYPACVVDPDRDADQSVVLINPYERPAVVTLEFEGLELTHRVRVDALTAKRIAFSKILDPVARCWSGQAFVSGSNRIVMFFVSHSMKNAANINTMEHSDPYRGASDWYPFTRALHFKFRTRNGLR